MEILYMQNQIEEFEKNQEKNAEINPLKVRHHKN